MLGRSLHQCVHVVPVNRPHLKPERRNHPRPANADSVPDIVEPKLFKKLSLTSRARNALLKCLTEFPDERTTGHGLPEPLPRKGTVLTKSRVYLRHQRLCRSKNSRTEKDCFCTSGHHMLTGPHVLFAVLHRSWNPHVLCVVWSCAVRGCFGHLCFMFVITISTLARRPGASSEATFTPLKTLQASCLATCLQHPGIKTSAFLQLVTRQ